MHSFARIRPSDRLKVAITLSTTPGLFTLEELGSFAGFSNHDKSEVLLAVLRCPWSGLVPRPLNSEASRLTTLDQRADV